MIALTAGIILFVAVAVWVFLPILRGESPTLADAETRNLQARRDILVAELREGALDATTGKLSEADWATLKATREEELAAILRRLGAAGRE